MFEQPSVFRAGVMSGKRVFVTGGGTGIGLAISAEMRMLGADVLIASRSEEHLEAGATALRAIEATGRVETRTCNVREPESIAEAVEYAMERLGGIDVLVNNAGGQFPSPAVAISRKGWDAVISTNLSGPFHVSQAVANRAMIPAQRGCIVNVIAQMWNGFPMMAHTGAARSGVDNLTKTLAFEWAPMGVRVNAVAPGVILSSGVESYAPENRKYFFESIPHIPAGRLGTTREVAAAVVFLASPAAEFITGFTLRVDGGETLFGHAAAQQMKEWYRGAATPEYR